MVLTSSNEKNTRPTAGPWRVEDVGIPGTLAIMAGSATEYRWIATVTEDAGSGVDWTQTQANAQLIAATPRMLDLLLHIVRYSDDDGLSNFALAILYEAGVVARPTSAKTESREQ